MEVLATAAEGTAPILADECNDLGLRVVHVRRDGVVLDLNTTSTAKALVHLRVATRLLLALDDVRCRDANDLYGSLKQIDWPRWLDDRHTIAVHATGALPGSPEAPERRGPPARGPAIRNHVFASQRGKDAICDVLRGKFDARPNVDLEDPDVRIVLRFRGDRCGVYLDISGEAMHRRGYRIDAVPAPMKETLAAAAVAIVDWDGTRPLIDPMCGSGTLIIEALMRHLNIAPGLHRDFAIERWPNHGEAVGLLLDKERDAAKEAADAAIANASGLKVIAGDFDRAALRATRTHLERAGLTDLVEVVRHNVRRMDTDLADAVVICNPPYGERIGGSTVTDLYEAMAQRWATLDRADVWVLDGHDDFVSRFGYRPRRSWMLRNGQLHVRWHHFRLTETDRLRGRSEPEVSVDDPAEVDQDPTAAGPVAVEAPEIADVRADEAGAPSP
ncbi:MAG: hypothetical protein KC502_12075 [Myxococcales bacterium]|nr:hypothetical protein [Myxococcales bacterium]